MCTNLRSRLLQHTSILLLIKPFAFAYISSIGANDSMYLMGVSTLKEIAWRYKLNKSYIICSKLKSIIQFFLLFFVSLHSSRKTEMNIFCFLNLWTTLKMPEFGQFGITFFVVVDSLFQSGTQINRAFIEQYFKLNIFNLPLLSKHISIQSGNEILDCVCGWIVIEEKFKSAVWGIRFHLRYSYVRSTGRYTLNASDKIGRKS